MKIEIRGSREKQTMITTAPFVLIRTDPGLTWTHDASMPTTGAWHRRHPDQKSIFEGWLVPGSCVRHGSIMRPWEPRNEQPLI